jgi:hypothetical protein
MAHDSSTTLQQDCRSCHKSSPKIYSEGWICLETACTAYWMLDTTIGLLPIPPGMKLAYDSPFLCPAKTPVDIKPPYSVIPPKPKGGIPDETGSGDSAGSRGLWRGDSEPRNCRLYSADFHRLGVRKLWTCQLPIPMGSLGESCPLSFTLMTAMPRVPETARTYRSILCSNSCPFPYQPGSSSIRESQNGSTVWYLGHC